MSHTGIRTLGGVVLLGLALAGCAGRGAGVMPSATVTTAIQGWEHYFRLDWAPTEKPTGQEIDGYIYNSYGAAASNVQILAQTLDKSGNLVAQRIAWVPGTVPALNRAYFRVPGLPTGDQYRVTVWGFDFVESSSVPQR